jgi:NitT/TauT family transport system permease protein
LRHISVTLAEMAIGLTLGGSLGVVVGLLLGGSPVMAAILRPAIVALYSVPLVALAPLLIMFFGLDMAPKIFLVTIVSFFLLFFNTFQGVTTVDGDLISSVQLMGANRFEQFRKVIAPGCMVWIVSGFKTALPYALVGATTGEMLASRAGMGFLITRSASQLDTTGIYAALVVLMLMGLVLSEVAVRCDRWILKWRPEAA